MFLKEYAVRRYGPLPDSGKRNLGRFNLFFGSNEDGKTLTIDALLRILFGNSALRNFQAIKRVDENPDGYIILELDNHNEIKLPDTGLLPDLLEIGAAEFANIFIIRDSNLAIANESSFYRGVTNRLTGMRSGEITRIISELQGLGQITNTGEFKNTAPEKLKDRLNNARLLMEKGKQLLENLLAEGYDGFEKELAVLNEQKSADQEQLKLQRAAAKRDKYETGLKALGKLKSALEAITSLEQATEDNYNTWRKAELSLEHLNLEKSRHESDLKSAGELLTNERTRLQDCKADLLEAEQQYSRVSVGLEGVLNNYDREQSLFCRWETLAEKKTLRRVVISGFVVFLLSLIGSYYAPQWWLYPLLVIAAVLILMSAVLQFIFLYKKGRFEQLRTELLAGAERLNLDAADVQTIRHKLGLLEERVILVRGQLSEAEKSLEWCEKEYGRVGSDLAERERQIKEVEAGINQIRKQTKIESVDQFAEIMKNKDLLNKEIEIQSKILESHFETGDLESSLAGRISSWEVQIDSFSRFTGVARGEKSDRTKVSQLNESITGYEEQIGNLKDRLAERKEELRNIERDLNEIFFAPEEGEITCETTADLKEMIDRLEKWVKDFEANRSMAQAAIELFEVIEREEEQKVSALFGNDSPVNGYFENITGGLYRKISYDTGDNQIRITRQDGLELNADQLSGGAYDQLYFSVRLALGEKMLKGGKGFFILDDPFIKADPKRLESLVSMLFKICADGWQILYFSSKGEIRKALEKKITAGEVKIFPINPSDAP